jgi:hypothetical protein
MGNDFVASNKGHQVREVISKLGKTIQDGKGNLRKFIYDGVTSRYALAESFEWLIFVEILSKVFDNMLELFKPVCSLGIIVLKLSIRSFVCFWIVVTRQKQGSIC